jgi:hypothetical protein
MSGWNLNIITTRGFMIPGIGGIHDIRGGITINFSFEVFFYNAISAELHIFAQALGLVFDSTPWHQFVHEYAGFQSC